MVYLPISWSFVAAKNCNHRKHSKGEEGRQIVVTGSGGLNFFTGSTDNNNNFFERVVNIKRQRLTQKQQFLDQFFPTQYETISISSPAVTGFTPITTDSSTTGSITLTPNESEEPDLEIEESTATEEVDDDEFADIVAEAIMNRKLGEFFLFPL